MSVALGDDPPSPTAAEIPITLWRIAAETRQYAAADLSGRGAAKCPGRWNDEGEFVVYAAQTLSLAVLETLAHLDSDSLPLNRFVVRLQVPARLWCTAQCWAEPQLPPAWNAIPAGMSSVQVGSAWYKAGRSALLCVPSTLVPEETVVLINRQHPDAQAITADVVRPFVYQRVIR